MAQLLMLSLGLAAAVHARARGQAANKGATSAGEIVGTIYFKGDKPKLPAINMANDPVCVSEQTGTVYVQDGEVNSNGTLPNALVYVKSQPGSPSLSAPRNSVDLTQQGCMYEPHVLGVMVGQPLQVVTLDPTMHNVHVLPKINREWNVTQRPGSPSIIKTFTQPEIMIPVHCNAHPWMKAYIGVVSNPYYSVTGTEGSFVIKDVPPGEYTLAVWTATFGIQEHRVTMRAGESSTVDFTFENR
ncbi:MAG TPA: carboxypeptidase regulatory-like domain-containing protein [Candidatus Acidoferrales bacterium]|nr:carboxypeptidase regulatory-like domain-containing protein [Candidatus Acidoferrales bacterium]